MDAYHPPTLVDKSPNVFAAVLTLAIVAVIVFPLRAYVRISNKAWGIDDTLMTVATVPFLTLTVACLGGPFHGVGVHDERLTAQQKTTGLMWFFLFEVFYCISIIFIKLSISFMLIRVAGPVKKYIWSLYVCSAIFTLSNLVSLLYIIFQCTPVSYAWDTSTPGGSCNPAQILADIYYADTAVNIVTDWFCALLPIPLLWDIQLNRNVKISIVFLLGMGVLASISACIRLKYTVNLNNSTEYLHSVGDIVIWGYAENGVGFIVGCTSTLRPLFRRVFGFGSTSGPSEARGQSGMDPIEFNTYTGPRANKFKTIINTGEGGYNRASSSEEQLVKDSELGIQVSKTVRQDRE